MSRPTVTIVVPSYNVEAYLGKCIDSLVAQTYPDLEIVLVDDGSTDRTGALCDLRASDEPRIQVVHQANGGLSNARNSGLAVARGTYVAFLDADDWAERTWIEDMVRIAESTGSEVVIEGAIVDWVEADGSVARSERREFPVTEPTTSGVLAISDDPTSTELGLLGYAWNKLYRRALLTRITARFEEGTSLVEDMLFNVNVLTETDRVTFAPTAHVHYVQRERTTLGTAFYPDQLQLRVRSIEALGTVLSHWRVPEQTRKRVAVRLKTSALASTARKIAVQPSTSLRDRRSALATTFGDPLAVRLLEDVRHWRAHSRSRNLVLAALRRRHYGAVLFLARAGRLRLRA